MRNIKTLLNNTIAKEVRVELRFGDCSGVTLTMDRRALHRLARKCDSLVKGVELDRAYKAMMLGDLYVISFNAEDEAFVRSLLEESRTNRRTRPQRSRR